jgi:hypothetical protein
MGRAGPALPVLRWWVLAVAWLVPAAASAQQTTYTLAPTADTYLRSNQGTNNFGTQNSISVEPAARQALLQFDISSIPSAHIILSAKLRLYVSTAASTSTVRAHRTTASWTETGATWNNMNANYDANVEASASPATAGVFLEFDVLSLVRAWRSGTSNYGFMMTATGSSQSAYASRENGTVANRPQLVVVATAEPSYSVTKLSQVISDPANGTTQPKRMPGAVIEYSVNVSSTNSNVSDSNSIVLVEAVPSQATLFVGDLGGAGSGPVSFTDGSPTSGLTYTYSGLASGTDDLSFSSDGGLSYAYAPVPDADGYDSAVTHLRIAPKGIFAGSIGSGDPDFSVAFRAKNK